jgi:hypothetical protein
LAAKVTERRRREGVSKMVGEKPAGAENSRGDRAVGGAKPPVGGNGSLPGSNPWRQCGRSWKVEATRAQAKVVNDKRGRFVDEADWLGSGENP